MSLDTFDRKIEQARERVAALFLRDDSPPEAVARAAQAAEGLAEALEELQVAEEELRQQNEELAAAREALEGERRRYQELFDFAPDAYLVTTPHGLIQEANRAAARLLNVPQGYLAGKPLFSFLHEGARRAVRREINQIVTARPGDAPLRLGRKEPAPPAAQEIESSLQPRQLAAIDAAITVAPVRDPEGQVVALRWMIRDITGRKRAEETVRTLNLELEQRVQERTVQLEFQARLLDAVEQAVIATDLDGTIRFWSRFAEKLYGWPTAEALGRNIMEIILAERSREQAEEIMARLKVGESWMGEFVVRRRDGATFTAMVIDSPIYDEAGALIGIVGVSYDVTERKRAEDERVRLLASERQKSEQLVLAVREAHHRIKNNLQAVSDLLYLQLSTGDAPVPGKLLRDSIERIQTIGLVHDLLSQDEDVRTVDMRAVADRLIPMVLCSNGLADAGVGVEVQVPPIPLSSKKATTLALILNELVSNAAKHAFAGRRGGRLRVQLSHADDGLCLHVQDDGPGLPPGFQVTQDADVGLEVVRTLAERDLDGTLMLSEGPGLVAEVWFPW